MSPLFALSIGTSTWKAVLKRQRALVAMVRPGSQGIRSATRAGLTLSMSSSSSKHRCSQCAGTAPGAKPGVVREWNRNCAENQSRARGRRAPAHFEKTSSCVFPPADLTGVRQRYAAAAAAAATFGTHCSTHNKDNSWAPQAAQSPTGANPTRDAAMSNTVLNACIIWAPLAATSRAR
jgi:hypothetical protein